LFISHLIVAAGYTGWVLLVDEAELIGRYSLKQRARSYSEMARLLGRLEGENIPGLVSVFTISGDFESAVFIEKNDEEKIPAKFRESGHSEDALMAIQAEMGMRIIRQEKNVIEPLNTDIIRSTFDKLRLIYSAAYGWDPPQDFIQTPVLTSDVIRKFVKRWITEWDLKRYYPDYHPDIEISQLKPDYEEAPDLEQLDEETQETGHVEDTPAWKDF